MENDFGYQRPELEVKELALKVRELELKVKDLELPLYKKLSFWTSLITILIAVLGIGLQSFLSSIRNEKAELKVEEAKKELTLSLARKDSAEKAIANAQRNLTELENKRLALLKDLDSLGRAFTEVTNDVAFDADPAQPTQSKERFKNIVTQTSDKISTILLRNSSEDLLKSSVLRIYHSRPLQTKANAINDLLSSRGVNTNYSLAPYDISDVNVNEIVYYNKPQLNYCLAVQSLLKQSGYGEFRIRLSSGANATTSFFKIYLVK